MKEATSSFDLTEISHAARSLSAKAAESMVHFRKNAAFEVSYKGKWNIVTSADHAADKIIVDGIKAAFPSHAILSEESSPDLPPEALTKGPLWIVDPIDGTVNYAHGLHETAVSIAFAFDGVVQFGIVQGPFLNETFSAVKGGGAFCNEIPIRCSAADTLEKALVGTGFPYDRSNVALLARRVQQVLTHCQDLRRIGSGALDICFVACGRLDGFYESLAPWDMAAASLIAREAGAQVGHLSNDIKDRDLPVDLKSNELLVANPVLFPLLKKILV